MNKKRDDATKMADMIYGHLDQMIRWGAGFTIQRRTDRIIEIQWSDGTGVDIKVSIPKPSQK